MRKISDITSDFYEECVSHTASLLKKIGSTKDPLDIVHEAIIHCNDCDSIMNVVKRLVYGDSTGMRVEVSVPDSSIGSISNNKSYVHSDMQCTVCRQPLPESEFASYIRKNGIKVKEPRCKACRYKSIVKSRAKKRLYYLWVQRQINAKNKKEREILLRNVKLTGLLHGKCKNCGPLPISKFYIQRTRHGKHRPANICKSCCSDVYKQKYKDAPKKPNKKNRKKQYDCSKKKREALSDYYIVKMLKQRGYSQNTITKKLMQEQRESVLAYRERKNQKQQYGL